MKVIFVKPQLNVKPPQIKSSRAATGSNQGRKGLSLVFFKKCRLHHLHNSIRRNQWRSQDLAQEGGKPLSVIINEKKL